MTAVPKLQSLIFTHHIFHKYMLVLMLIQSMHFSSLRNLLSNPFTLMYPRTEDEHALFSKLAWSMACSYAALFNFNRFQIFLGPLQLSSVLTGKYELWFLQAKKMNFCQTIVIQIEHTVRLMVKKKYWVLAVLIVPEHFRPCYWQRLTITDHWNIEIYSICRNW